MDNFAKITEKLKEGENILIISHNKPDGDTVGANLALRIWLEEMGKRVTSACADPLTESLKFLPKADTFTDSFLLEDYDTIVIVDAGAKHLVKFFNVYPEMGRTKKPIICIDHHSSNDLFGSINLIDPEATSTTSLLYKEFKKIGAKITPDMATCLLNGIYTDTGSFMHTNTKPETLQLSSELIRLGADYKSIAKNNFKRTTVKKLKILGEVLNNIEYDVAENRIVTGVTNQTFQNLKVSSDDLTGAADFITSVPKARYTILLAEDNKGRVKASLRTRRDDVDVAKIAENHGGGGHSKAAGFRIHGRLNKKINWEVKSLKELKQYTF